MTDKNPVVFVGAGPGDPDLITVAGRRALERADLVVYAGSLVSTEMLSWCAPEVRAVDSAGLALDEIVASMVEGWEQGLKVVRLHTGDPSLYGAVLEQFRALQARGVPYRVVPGVTSAFAAAAALGMEYTIPELGQSLILTRASGRTPVPEKEGLDSLAAHGCSLAIYLSAGQAGKVGQSLEKAFGPDAPVVVAYRVSWPDQDFLKTTASRLAGDMERAGIKRQALILAGPGVAAAVADVDAPASRLYHASFSHGFRSGREG